MNDSALNEFGVRGRSINSGAYHRGCNVSGTWCVRPSVVQFELRRITPSRAVGKDFAVYLMTVSRNAARYVAVGVQV